MSAFLIDTKITTSTAGAAAFSLGGIDSLVLTGTGTLAALGTSGYGLFLLGSNAVTIRGTVYGVTGGIADAQTNSSRITVSASGLVGGGGNGILLTRIGVGLDNHGEVVGGSGSGASMAGSFSRVFNSGVLEGNTGLTMQGEFATVTNTGVIQGSAIGINASGQFDRIVNHGLIASTSGNQAALLMNGGGAFLTNTGTIASTGENAISFLGSTTTGNEFNNQGLVAGSITFTAITGGNGTDTLRNSGTIQGAVALQGGNDFFDGRNGLQGQLRGNDGDDTLLGGAAAETLQGGNGADSIDGAAGDDIINGGFGPDTLDGGAGDRDILDYAGSDGVNVDLASGATSFGDAAGDVISGFEWVSGSILDDVIAGDAGVNGLFGRDGHDMLNGVAGNDRLVGGFGLDTLIGGLGADVLSGGAGNDIFRYEASAESTLPSRDRITDFASIAAGGADRDRIDLSAIDAITGAGTANDAFTFIGGAGFTAAGQVRIRTLGDLTYVSANMDANTASIELIIALTVTTLGAGDFIL